MPVQVFEFSKEEERRTELHYSERDMCIHVTIDGRKIFGPNGQPEGFFLDGWMSTVDRIHMRLMRVARNLRKLK